METVSQGGSPQSLTAAPSTEKWKALVFPTEPQAPTKLWKYHPEFLVYGFFCGRCKHQADYSGEFPESKWPRAIVDEKWL